METCDYFQHFQCSQHISCHCRARHSTKIIFVCKFALFGCQLIRQVIFSSKPKRGFWLSTVSLRQWCNQRVGFHDRSKKCIASVVSASYLQYKTDAHMTVYIQIPHNMDILYVPRLFQVRLLTPKWFSDHVLPDSSLFMTTFRQL